MIFTDTTVQITYDVLTALSRCHARGTLLVPLADVVAESGHTEYTTKLILDDADSMEWARLQLSGHTYLLHEGVVRPVNDIVMCDLCSYLEHGKQTRAIADAYIEDGHWANVCVHHFVQLNCTLGLGRGQLLAFQA